MKKTILIISLFFCFILFGCKETIQQYIIEPGCKPLFVISDNYGNAEEYNFRYIYFNNNINYLKIDSIGFYDFMRMHTGFSCYNPCGYKMLLVIQLKDSTYQSYIFDSLYYLNSNKNLYWIFEGQHLYFRNIEENILNFYIDGK
jgi:hypothetical protein